MSYGAGFAAFYDRHWRGFSERAAERIIEWYTADQPEGGRRVLDLCCGTGASAEPFVTAGFDVTGVDLSPDMVALARERAAEPGGARERTVELGVVPQRSGEPDGHVEGGGRVRYLVGDATDPPLPAEPGFDLVVSLYDSLNHLPDLAALRRVFAAAAARTRPGGVLVFDLNTDRGLAGWEVTEVVDDETGTLIARGSHDAEARTARLELIGYRRQPDGSFRRFTDAASERAFDLDQVLEALGRTGWSGIRLTGYGQLAEPLADPDAETRVVLLARRAEPAG